MTKKLICEVEDVEIYYSDKPIMDCYTVIIAGDVYGMSKNPLSPQGINQYCGTEISKDFLKTQKRVEFVDLSNELQKAILQRMECQK